MTHRPQNRTILLFIMLSLLLTTGCASMALGHLGSKIDRSNATLVTVPLDSLLLLRVGDLLIVNTHDQKRIRGYLASGSNDSTLVLSGRLPAVPDGTKTITLGNIERIQRYQMYPGFERFGSGLGLVVDVVLVLFAYWFAAWAT
ncbi:hypothetical protein KQI63_04535 [bacterium]|nr:hypothetical protein [bacterium]